MTSPDSLWIHRWPFVDTENQCENGGLSPTLVFSPVDRAGLKLLKSDV